MLETLNCEDWLYKNMGYLQKRIDDFEPKYELRNFGISLDVFVKEALGYQDAHLDNLMLKEAFTLEQVYDNLLSLLSSDHLEFFLSLSTRVCQNINKAKDIRSSLAYKIIRWGRNKMRKRILYANILLHEIYSQFSNNASIKEEEKTRILDSINSIWFFLNIRENLTENDFYWINHRCIELMVEIFSMK